MHSFSSLTPISCIIPSNSEARSFLNSWWSYIDGEYIVYFGVFKFVFLFVVKHHAVMVYEIEDANPPQWTVQELQ
jgi:hypothetical protein